jgi:hypothetical protein
MTDAAPPPHLAPEPGDDLAANRPGGELRQKSSEIREAHPFLTLLGRVLGVHNQERAWSKGAAGEEEVAWRLRKLGDGWRVIHGVPVGTNDSDIDHVVIGPAGVFTLNTKNHLGGRVSVNGKAIYVNGTYQPYLRNSQFEGQRASRLLTTACGFAVEARPVIVVMADTLTFKGQPDGVHVVARKKVAKWLSTQPAVLATGGVEAIYAVARRR